jgi:tetraacyldisaccharide 4'-kinase
LLPISWLFAGIVTRRNSRIGWRAPVPVICSGNATVGGAGKTTVTLDLANRLRSRGIAVHILLRGYRGAARGTRRVQPDDTVFLTGDEALLLAEAAPTWIGADRAASARCAIAAGAELLLLDDGLQNQSLAKTASLLIVDGVTGFGNGLVFPAGPLREPVAAATLRCSLAVLIGPDVTNSRRMLQTRLPVLHAELVQNEEISVLVGKRTLAFTGIAFPKKFFTALEQAGLVIVERKAFPDHHIFTQSELVHLETAAQEFGAVLATTPKDAVRLPNAMAVHVVGVHLAWGTEAALEVLLDRFIFAQNLHHTAVW